MEHLGGTVKYAHYRSLHMLSVWVHEVTETDLLLLFTVALFFCYFKPYMVLHMVFGNSFTVKQDLDGLLGLH